MTLFQSIDGYCERLTGLFGAEPFNMATGLVFLGVGALAYRRAPAGADRAAALSLMGVGLAAPLHHGFGLGLTLWLDVVANLVFLASLGVLLITRLAGARMLPAIAAALVLVALVFCLGQSRTVQSVLPAGLSRATDAFLLLLVLMTGIAIGLRHRHPGTARTMAGAAVVLAAGLPFRFLDSALCPVWTLGTHGIWHLLNALATAMLLAALARHRRAG